MASTVGVSAFVGTDGSGARRDRLQHPGGRWSRDMRLGGTRTLATRLGYWPEVALVGAGGGRPGRRGLRPPRRRPWTQPGRRRRNGERRRVTAATDDRGLPGRRPGPGRHPDLQRGRQHPRHHRPGPPGGARRRHPRRRRQQPRRHRRHRRRAGRRRRRTSTCCTGPASRASARRTWPASPGPASSGYDAVVEMDADGSHAPEELPALLDALRDADVVLGSRWVPGGKVRQLAGAPAACCPAAATSTPGWRWACRSRTPPAATAAYRMPVLDKIDLELGRVAGLLASRSSWPGAPTAPGSGSSRCRSRSPSASAARAR